MGEWSGGPGKAGGKENCSMDIIYEMGINKSIKEETSLKFKSEIDMCLTRECSLSHLLPLGLLRKYS